MNASRSPAPVAKSAVSETRPMDVLDAAHRDIAAMLVQLHTLLDHVNTHEVDEVARDLAHKIHVFFSTVALQHHLDEENHIFPALLRDADDALRHALAQLQQDHAWLEANWMELAPQLDSMARGYNWHSMDEVRHGIELFTGLYEDHVALEESLIYPKAKAQMNPGDYLTMSREMAARRSLSRAKQAAQRRP